MKRTVLVSTLVIALIAGLVGAATWAYFSDVETSSGNTFTAGTLDLELSGTYDSTSLPVALTNMAPGDQTTVTLNMTNVGSLAGDLSFQISYVDADGTPTGEFGADMSADDFAKGLLILDPVNYTPAGGSVRNVYNDWLSYAGAHDGNGANLSVYDVKTAGTWTMSEPLTAAGTATIVMTVQLDPNAGNEFQADGIAVTITGTLNQ